MRTSKFRSAAAAAAALAVSILLAGQAPAIAATDGSPSPNGSSPWNYAESWAITGSYYGEGFHTDANNDYYAMDWAIPGNGCNKRLYAFYDGMRVTSVGGYNNMVEMQKTIGGYTYRVRYLHLASITTSVNATVGTNTIVGYSGATGNAVGCHLHLSVHRLRGSTWYSVPPQFCGRTYPHDHTTRFKGC